MVPFGEIIEWFHYLIFLRAYVCIHSAAKRFPASARELKGLNFVDSQIPGWMKVEDAEPVTVPTVETVPPIEEVEVETVVALPTLGSLPLGLETPIVEYPIKPESKWFHVCRYRTGP